MHRITGRALILLLEMDKAKLSWRSFVDNGAIAEKWKPAGTPSFFIIDPGGVIRHK